MYRWSAGVAPLILNLGIKIKWVVSLTLRQLYPRGRAPGSLCWSPGGSQGPVWTFWRRNHYLAPVGIRTPDLSARRQYTDHGFTGNLAGLARDWRLTCSGYGVYGGDYWVQLIVGRVSGGDWVWKECASLAACVTEFPGNYNSPNAVTKICAGRLSTTLNTPPPLFLPPYCKPVFLPRKLSKGRSNHSYSQILVGTWKQQLQKLALI
jgi:hypothetical protein